MCRSSRAIIFHFNSKTQWRMFLLLYMSVSLRRKQTWRLHTKLSKFGWHTSANNARMKNSRGLILGEVVYISIIYRISDSWLYSLNYGYEFSFDHMTGENRELRIFQGLCEPSLNFWPGLYKICIWMPFHEIWHLVVETDNLREPFQLCLIPLTVILALNSYAITDTFHKAALKVSWKGPFLYTNSTLASRVRGIKQSKSILHPV